MKIGLTYDLRSEYLKEGYGEEETAEFDKEETIDALESALRETGYATDRIGHLRNLVQRLAAGERWDLVFNIAEGLYGYSREAVIPALLEAYRIACTFSDPLTLAVALHKETAKRIVRSFGVPTPDFATVVSEADVSRLTLTGRLFAKPIAEGTGKGIGSASMVTNRQELLEVCRRLLHMYRQPVLVEQYLPGREFTVGIIGTGEQAEAIGVIEVVSRSTADAHAYGYENKEFCEERIDYVLASGDLADQAKRVSLAAWNALNCRDGGRVDVRADDTGVIHFLEVNPLAGLHPTHSDLPIVCGKVGISYRELIERIVKSALSRVQMF